MRCSDSLPSLRARFVSFARPYRAWARSSLPGEGSPPAWVLGLFTRLPTGLFGAETTGPPRFLDIPHARMLRSRTPVEPRCQATFDTSMLPSAVVTTSASTSSNFRGSITQPTRSLCTLRSAGYPDTTQHSVLGWWPAFAGRVWLPARMFRGFQSPSILLNRLSIPPPQALPGATQLLVISHRQREGTRLVRQFVLLQ